MRRINPLPIWIGGQTKQAEFLSGKIIEDDLNTKCLIRWKIYEEVITIYDETNPKPDDTYPDRVVKYNELSTGQLTITGDEYVNWDGSNNQAYEIIASKLNLTLVVE